MFLPLTQRTMRSKEALIPASGKCSDARRLVKLLALIVAAFILTNSSGYGQSNYQALTKIDNLVQQIDSLSHKTQITFYLNKIRNKFDGVKETWHYTMRDGKVVVFQVRYILDSTEFTEVYYLNRGALMYFEEYETVYYSSSGDDEIKWGGIYYFVSNSLKQGVTLGDRTRKFRMWNAEVETLTRFQRRFSELQENIALTAKN